MSEYIGSKIYESIGIPVHKTLLGTYNLNGKEKVVVACKDFVDNDCELIEFGDIKVTFLPTINEFFENESSGSNCDMYEIKQTIEEHPILQKVSGVKERFWDMFIVDALIGNADRNNGNWEILHNKITDEYKLAPVFDNGNSLNDKWEDECFQLTMEDSTKLLNVVKIQRTCVFTINNKLINPYKYIESLEDIECNLALIRIFPKINLDEINNIIDDIEYISDIRKNYYKLLLKERYEKILKVSYLKLKSSDIRIKIIVQEFKIFLYFLFIYKKIIKKSYKKLEKRLKNS